MHEHPSAADRQQRLTEAHQLLALAVEQMSSSADWLTMLEVSRRLPAYSPNNCLLLAMQGAEGMVMGYRAWLRVPAQDGGFCQVRRGAKSLAILAPVTITADQPDSGNNERVRRVIGFRRAAVFDQRALVSPPELPDLTPRPLTGQAPDRLADALVAQILAAGYRIIGGQDAAGIAPAYGRTDFECRSVAVRPDLSPAQRVKTLAHELAHIRLHAPDVRPPNLSRPVAEVEAESVAYLISGELGLDTGDYTFRYVTAWSNGDPTVVTTTASRAVTAAREITDMITRQLTVPAPAAGAGLDPVATLDPVRPPQPPAVSAELSILDDAGPADYGVRIGTASGRWELGWDPPLGTVYARHHSLDADSAGQDRPGEPPAGIWLGTDASAIPTVGDLEAHLGFPLPAGVRDYLQDDQLTRPAHSVRRFHLLDRDPPAEVPEQARPTASSPLEVPGQPTRSYGEALRGQEPLRVWQEDSYRVELLTATRFYDPETRSHRQAITYRLYQDGRVVYSGDDIECPDEHDAASDESVRAVVNLLTLSSDPPITQAQQRFLDSHAEQIAGLLDPPEPPYPPGARIAVTSPGAAPVTGVVVDPVTDTDGHPIAYAWRPDRTDLPGHPWHDQPQHTLVSPAEHVTPTLAALDSGLAGWTPRPPLAYGARVEILDPNGEHRTGQVLRAVAEPTGLAYDIRPDPAGPPERLPAGSIHPTRGTAWPSIDDLMAVRAQVGLVLLAGEVLAAGGQVAHVVAGPHGPALRRDPPPRPALTPGPPTPADPGTPAPRVAPDLPAPGAEM